MIISLCEKPVVSVIIPYNVDRGYLREAVGSVMLQKYRHIELILSQSNDTVGANINNGVNKAKGEWIKILAEDDVLPEDSLMEFSKFFDKYDWMVSDAWNFGNPIWETVFKGKLPTTSEMLKLNCIHGGSVIYKKSLFEDTGGYDQNLITAEEYDFHLLLLKDGYKVGYIPKITYHYRIHGKNKYIEMKNKTPEFREEYISKIIKSRYGKRSDRT